MAKAAQKRHSGSVFETQRIIEAGKRKLQKWQKNTTGKRRWQKLHKKGIEAVYLKHREL